MVRQEALDFIPLGPIFLGGMRSGALLFFRNNSIHVGERGDIL